MKAMTRGALIGLATLLASTFGLFTTLDLRAVDLLFALRGVEQPQAPIVIVSIGEDSFDELNLAWPWPRSLHAELLDRLKVGHPAAIGFDIAFPEPSARGSADDRTFAEAIGRAGNVILAAALTTIEEASYAKVDLNPPIPVLRERAAGYGLVNFLVDDDAFVRTAEIEHNHQGQRLPSFALALAHVAAQAGVQRAPTPGHDVLINFRGGPKSYPTIPYYQILRGEVRPEIFTGKIVLVGATSPVLHDLFPTPFAARGDMPGVEIQANFLETLLRGIPIRRAPGGVGIILTLAAAIAAVWLTLRYRPVLALALVGVFAAGFLTLAYGLFAGSRLVVPVLLVPTALLFGFGATLLESFILEQRQRTMLMQLFSRHVSPEVADAIWAQRDAFLAGGRLSSQKLVATVLFTDLKGFTGISERMDTHALMDWINGYMEVMAKLVTQYGGVVDDYFGDAIKANFGVPFARASEAERARDAVNAVECALAMGKELQRLNAQWQAQSLPAVAMRIGICTGEVVAGCVGSAERLKFTTIGDTVNTASRLESYEKDLEGPDPRQSPCRILVAETTQAYLGNRFWTQRAGSLQLKGKERPLTVYRVFGTKEEASWQRVDLRKTARVPVTGRVVLSGGHRTDALVSDVSVGGVAVSKLPHQVPIGDLAQLQFELPGLPSHIQVKGAVVWASRDRAGFAFRDMEAEARRLLEEFIKQQTHASETSLSTSP
jgi:adenylate cyclase